MTESIQIRSIKSLEEINPETWDELNTQAGGSVLGSHAFLSAFEKSGSVCPETGWQAHHLLLERNGDRDNPLAVMPLYLKGHSYGEFVFDWSWAQAYERHGLNYYPKWLSATPFTPVTSERLLCSSNFKSLAAQALLQSAKASGLSSLHILYTSERDQAALLKAGCLARHHIQFHWKNQGWRSFDDFLADLLQSKRKKIRAERRKVELSGVTTRVITGAQISGADWDFFYRCYANTYKQRGNSPYLTRDFFDLIPQNNCVLVMACVQDKPVASSFLLLDQVTDGESAVTTKRLYGRYWGSLQQIECLHFEMAYYSPIQWAIEHEIDVIEGGAQGEHKIARGFTPVRTSSAHWLAHKGFSDAVRDFLEQEKQAIEQYDHALHSPFRSTALTKPSPE